MIVRLYGVGITFLVNVMLTRGLGVEAYGVYSFFFAIVSLGALLTEFGLPVLVVRETSRAIAIGALGRMTSLWRWAHGFIAVNTCVVGAVLWIWLRYFGNSTVNADIALYIGLILIPLFAISNLRAAILRGLGYDLLGQLPEHAIRPTLFAIGMLAALFMSGPSSSVAVVFSIQVVATALAMIFGVYLLWKLAPRSNSDNLSEAGQRGWFRAALYLGSSYGLVLINNSVDIIMLGLWRSDAEVGHYRLASMVGALITLGLQTMNIYAMPHITRYLASDEKDKLKKIIVHSTRLSFGFGVMALVFILVLGESALAFFFGSGFSVAFPIVLVLAVGHLVNAFFGPVRAVMVMANQERLATLLTGIGTIANIGMNILLIPIYGAIGAAVASAVSIVLTQVVTFVVVWRQHGLLCWPFLAPRRIVR